VCSVSHFKSVTLSVMAVSVVAHFLERQCSSQAGLSSLIISSEALGHDRNDQTVEKTCQGRTILSGRGREKHYYCGVHQKCGVESEICVAIGTIERQIFEVNFPHVMTLVPIL